LCLALQEGSVSSAARATASTPAKVSCACCQLW
jgi:hypothetical protein